ncbi:hypothetical protein OQA88_12776 [Cercophora sp. LCS_1]
MPSKDGNPQGRKRLRSQNEDPPSAPSTNKRRRVQKTEATVDEPLPDPPTLISTAKKGPLRSSARAVTASKPTPTKKPTGDPWEIPDSEDERSTQKPGPKRPHAETTRGPQAASSKRSVGGPKSKNAVYDVPDSDEAETPRPSRGRKSASAISEPKPKDSAKPAGTGRGTLRVSTKASAEEVHVATTDTPTKPRSAKRAAPAAQEPTSDGSDDEPAEASPVPKSGRRQGAVAQQGKTVHSRKSVSFGNDKNEETFEDAISKSASKPVKGGKQPAPKQAAKEEAPSEEEDEDDGDEEDDEVCAICSKPDSKRGNEIVFCDNCDSGFHQECYNLPKIPDGDWICRNCSQEEATELAVSGKTVKAIAQKDQKPDIPNFEQHLGAMQRVLLDRCTGRRRIKLCGQDEAYDKASTLVEQTVVAGEGNSMLVIGARGCGKTTLVESILSDMTKQHKGQFHVVRLNGFIHTDDKLALREIWRQLGKEMEVEDELISKTNNYADTMASLLALLSHPSEIAESHEGITSKSVIFVIDEFDLFATHARQTLLYNLFDIAQARKAPIAVLGLTTRIDVVESLEKRVKSRFSHRYVYLSLPKSLPAFWDVCRQGLTIDDEDMVVEELDPKVKGHREFWKWWNKNLEVLRKSTSFQDHLESHFCSTKSVSAFLTTCIIPLSSLSPTLPSLKIPSYDISLEPPDSKLHVLESLSDLDLSMLIAAARLDIVAHTDTVNFAMAYDEYTSLMGRQRVQSATSGMLALGGGARVWGRGIASMAWERLVTLGMLIPAATVGRGAAGQSGLDAKMWKVDVALEEIPAAVKLGAVLGKWCREI